MSCKYLLLLLLPVAIHAAGKPPITSENLCVPNTLHTLAKGKVPYDKIIKGCNPDKQGTTHEQAPLVWKQTTGGNMTSIYCCTSGEDLKIKEGEYYWTGIPTPELIPEEQMEDYKANPLNHMHAAILIFKAGTFTLKHTTSPSEYYTQVLTASQVIDLTYEIYRVEENKSFANKTNDKYETSNQNPRTPK